MRISRKTLCALALASAATVSQLRADESPRPATSDLVSRPAYIDATATPPDATATPPASEADKRLLMGWLDTTPIGKTLEATRIKVYGWAEASYEFDFSHPPADIVNGRAFDFNQPHDFFLNELDLNIERPLDLAANQFDIGGRVEVVYGTDAPQIHSSDLTGRVAVFRHSNYGFDLHQLYVDVGIPVGNGLRVRFGKFEFFRPLDPDASVFYTHTFAYAFAFPFTLTGISAMYPVTKAFSVEFGISRGFNQSETDNNSVPDFFGRVRLDITDRTHVVISAISGAENNGNNGDNTTLLDIAVNHNVTDDFALLFDAMYAHQDGQLRLTGGTGSDNYYGVSGNAIYRISNGLDLAGRLEWYRDETGAAYNVLFPPGSFTGAQGFQLYEATVGLTITPFPQSTIGSKLKLRPELRYDYCNHGFFNGGTKNGQTTFSIDAIFNF